MIRVSLPHRRRPAESVVPMINVAFLLLIFFLMVAVIAPPDPEEVTLPEAKIQSEAQEGVVLVVTREGRVIRAGVDDATPLDQLANRDVTIKADATLPATTLAELIGTLQKSGVGSITLAVEPF